MQMRMSRRRGAGTGMRSSTVPSIGSLGRSSRLLALAFVTPVCPGETEGRRRSKGTPRAVFVGECCRRAGGGEIRGVSRAGQPSRECMGSHTLNTGPTCKVLAGGGNSFPPS